MSHHGERYGERERLLDLLTLSVTDGLATGDENDLVRLLTAHPDIDPASFERAAAATTLSDRALGYESMPASIRAEALEYAFTYLDDAPATNVFDDGGTVAPADARGRSGGTDTHGRERPPIAIVPGTSHRNVLGIPRPEQGGNWWSGMALWAAAAAVAVLVWTTFIRDGGQDDPGSLVASFETFLAEAPDLVRRPWQVLEDPATTNAEGGEIVWSTSEQRGYMVFDGLAVNDPGTTQYQLWIFDANQDERYPIDGGVFDVDVGSGRAIVPIDPKLHVVDPKMFAVTVEKPGGVVVSSRERIVTLAVVETS